ncbi:MAG: hypothetical protein ACP5FH_01850 [Terracidiphilus sp.]
MSSQTWMSLMCVAEFALWAVLGFFFWKRKFQHRFPAMGIYLALHLAAAPVLLFLIYSQNVHRFEHFYLLAYAAVYWAVYLASAVLIYFICIEVFRSALSAFSGLQKLGGVIFRWAVLASAIVSLSSLSLAHPPVCVIREISFRLMHSVSILELCLLGFLCLSMNALRLSIRDMAFGIALGFGLMSSNDFILGPIISRNHSLTSPLQIVNELVILVGIGLWITYVALPEPVRKPVLLPASSALFRWNEIATALGYSTQVAVQPVSGLAFSEAEVVIAQSLKSRISET